MRRRDWILESGMGREGSHQGTTEEKGVSGLHVPLEKTKMDVRALGNIIPRASAV